MGAGYVGLFSSCESTEQTTELPWKFMGIPETKIDVVAGFRWF